MDHKCEQLHPQYLTQEDAAKQEFPCVTPDATTAEFWCEYSTEDEQFICLSAFPFPYPDSSVINTRKCIQHNVQIEIENMGICYILTNMEHFCMTTYECLRWIEDNGLSSDTPFKVKVSVKYYNTGGYYGSEEWESEINVDIIKSTP